MSRTIIQKIVSGCTENNYYMKRDDLLPFSFGGNKARKAEEFFKEIEKNGNDIVVTYGSSSSNHCRIISNMAASKGIKCYVVSPEEGYEETANSKMVALFGAEVVKTPLDKVSQTIDDLMGTLKKKSNPYFIMGGGHGNLGTKAYINAYNEIKEYEKLSGIFFDYIFHASGTGTTQAGLVCGQMLNGDYAREIIGISIARKLPRGRQVIVDSVKEYLGTDIDCENQVIFTDNYICGGYGNFDSKISDTIKRVLVKDGIALNTTYTGKAFSGMEQYIEENSINGKNILFINTGGGPLFFDDLERLR